MSTVELFKYSNEHYLPIQYSLLLQSSFIMFSFLDGNWRKLHSVTERISFSIIKTATGSVYIISDVCAASFTPCSIVRLCQQRHMTGFLMGCANQHVWSNMLIPPWRMNRRITKQWDQWLLILKVIKRRTWTWWWKQLIPMANISCWIPLASLEP